MSAGEQVMGRPAPPPTRVEPAHVDLTAVEPDVDRLQGQVHNLRIALATRDVLGQAKGVLMATLDVTADEAWSLLTQLSQRSNVKVRDIAALVCERTSLGELLATLPADRRPGS